MTRGAEDEPTSDLLAERKMRFLFALRTRGVTDSRVLTAMERIDRGLFVRGTFADRDVSIAIAASRRSRCWTSAAETRSLSSGSLWAETKP